MSHTVLKEMKINIRVLGVTRWDDMPCLGVRDLGDSTHNGPKSHGHVRVRRHPWDG